MAQHKHAPRECRVVKSEEYAGYGFNLYQEKNKPGQYIGRIEAGSPADKAGLKENDRLVEVNNVNIAGENHKQVVARIKSRATETVLLVADTACDEYHNERGIVITGGLASVIRTASEDDIDTRVYDNQEEEEEVIDTRMQRPSVTSTGMSKFVKVLPDQAVTERVIACEEKTRDTGSLGRQDSGVSEGDAEIIEGKRDSKDVVDLGLHLSVQEVKERIRRQRKHDPRTIPMKRTSGEWITQCKMIQNM